MAENLDRALYPSLYFVMLMQMTHKMNDRCKFCAKFGSGGLSQDPADTILFETENFVVTPTIGAIVPGWLLVTPKKHFGCMGAMGDGLLHELKHVCAQAEQMLSSRFGQTVQFEHGAVSPAFPVGCGIDHAHMHIVATQANLIHEADGVSSVPLIWKRIDSIDVAESSVTAKTPYLFIRDQSGYSWLCESHDIGSQVLRRAIAAHIGKEDQFDWKTHRFDGNIINTIEGVLSHAVETV